MSTELQIGLTGCRSSRIKTYGSIHLIDIDYRILAFIIFFYIYYQYELAPLRRSNHYYLDLYLYIGIDFFNSNLKSTKYLLDIKILIDLNIISYRK